MLEYSGKVVAVTGGCGALGSAVIEAVLEKGGEAVRIDVLPLEKRQAIEGVRDYCIDLTEADQSRSQFEAIGRVDALFNIAGGFSFGPTVWETDDEAFEHMLSMNLRTMLNAVRGVMPEMIRNGRGAIVNVGALGARSGAASMGAYIVSKSGVMRLTESLAEEVKEKGINVNAVLPGVIDTPANRAGMPDADPSLWVAPADLAAVICFLGSEQARAMHGALIPVSGLG